MAVSSTIYGAALRLEPLAGPETGPISAFPGRAVVIGRLSTNDVVLSDPSVSRRHAQLTCRGGTWFIGDLGSSHGTILNGVRLGPDEPAPLSDGDLVRLGPWTFRVGGPAARTRVQQTSDDTGHSMRRVQRPEQTELEIRAKHRLDLLLDAATRIAGASSMSDLAAAAIEAVLAGTGLPRAAFIRAASGGGAVREVEVVAAMERSADDSAAPCREQFTVSRSLVEAALQGDVVCLDDDSVAMGGHSIMQMGVHAAVCAPLMIDGQCAASIYADARHGDAKPKGGPGRGRVAMEQEAPAFCQGVARIAALALANLGRRELEQRQRQLESDLKAAREAQRLLMPKPEGGVGPVRWSMRSRPGRFVAGDLVDVFECDGGRIAVLLGDVSGKGVEAAMLMATAQAHLNASLRRHPDPAIAAADAGRHIAAHAQDGRFVTLWIGLIDAAAGRLTYVDAGHGYAFVQRLNEPLLRLESSGGPPLGVVDAPYQSDTVAIGEGSRLLLLSDGVVEQLSPEGEQFGQGRVGPLVSGGRAAAEMLDKLIAAVCDHAAPGRPNESVALSDDVTAVCIDVGSGSMG